MKDAVQNDKPEGLILLAAGGALAVYSVSSLHDGAAWALSPALFPLLVSLLLAFLGALLLLKNGKTGSRQNSAIEGQTANGNANSEACAQKNGTSWLSAYSLPVCVCFLTLLYAALLPQLGFIAATLLYSMVFLLLNGERHPLILALLPLALALAFYYLFDGLFGIMLP